MNKIIVILVFFSTILFSFGAGNFVIKDVKISSLPSDNKDVKEYVEKLEKEGVNHPNEYIMIGLTYDHGIKEAGIKENKKKAKFFYKKAIDKNIIYGNIRLAILLAEEGKLKEASRVLDDAYFSRKQTIDEDKIILNLEIQLSEKMNDSAKKYFFLTEDSKKYKNPDSELSLFFMKYYGKNGIAQDLAEAEKYLNKACTNNKITDSVKSFCENSSLIERY